MESDFEEYMKKFNRITIALIVLSMLAHSCGPALAESSEPFPDEEWNRTYNVPAMDDTHWMEQTSDGGYIIIGSVNHYFSNNNALSKDYIVVKTDAKGDQQWSGKFREEDEDRAGYEMQTYIMQTSDSGYLIAGSTEIFKTGSLNIWIRKLDAEGIEQWKKDFRESRPSRQFFGGNNITDRYNEADKSVRETSDGGFLIIGKTNHCQNCPIEKELPMDIWLMKIDPKGNEEWNRTLGRTDLEAYSFTVTPDGGFVLASFDHDTTWFKKSDQNGNEFSCFLSVRRKTIAETDEGFVVIGIGSASGDLKLMKFKNRDDPFAVFTYEPEYPGVNQTVTFDASVSNDPKGNITNYRWDFGDGNITDTTGKKVTHSYERIGEATVRLTVMNNSGGVNSTWKKVFVQKLMAPEDTLNVTFGNFSGAKYARETSDRGFIIAGRNDSTYEGWLIKTDPYGKEEWNWTFKGIEIKSVIQTQDGGFMVAGEYDMSEILLIKIDKTGKEEWNRLFKRKGIAPYLSFGIIFGDNGTVAQTHDGGYVVSGINRSVDMDFKTLYDAWLLKTDPQGNEEWSRILRGYKTGQNILSSVQETSDEGYIVTGTWWNPYGGANPSVRLIKTDQKGNEKWAWTRILSINDHAGPGLQTSDGGFVMMGTSSYFNQSNWTDYTGPEWNTDIWLMKTDAQGNEQWIKGNRVKKLVYESSFSATQDGGYIYSVIVQERPENDYENADIYGEIYSVKFVKLDSEGNIEWQKRDEGYSIKPTSDGGYVTARGFQLVKFGGVRHEPLQSGILQETPITTQTQTLRAVPHETSTIIPPEKTVGSEVFLAITALLVAITIRRNRR